VATCCRVLGLSKSGFYAWRDRPPSARAVANAALLEDIRRIHVASRETYGAPMIQAELWDEGQWVNRKRIARLLRLDGRQGITRRRYHGTTRRDPAVRGADDLVDRRFVAPQPNQLWVADITYIPTWVGFLYLAVVLDVFSRRIVGWAMADRMRAELVVEALEMAVARRRPDGRPVHHSDQGGQYTSLVFTQRCRSVDIDTSMGSKGDCFDNARSRASTPRSRRT
jgi:putative transposase